MNGAFRIAKLMGIDVYVHWTFGLLLAWITIANIASQKPIVDVAMGLIFMLAIFGCVVLHELGHALAARRYGIGTHNITLLPIGGVAQLERMPREPKQEMVVAIAGPLVNVAIAAVLFVVLLAVYGFEGFPDSVSLPQRLVGGPLLINLLVVNIALVVFNLLPAFPMDGGRVLRALLATQMDYARATATAASVGKSLAILLGVLGLFGNAMLVFVAVFVYLGAEGESSLVLMAESLRGLRVRDAMMRRFQTLRGEDTLRRAAEELLLGTQQDFPVLRADDSLLGIVRQQSIIRGLSEGGFERSVSSIVESPETVSASDPLDEVAQQMRQENSRVRVVEEHGSLVGVLSLENIDELVMIRSAVGHSRGLHSGAGNVPTHAASAVMDPRQNASAS